MIYGISVRPPPTTSEKLLVRVRAGRVVEFTHVNAVDEIFADRVLQQRQVAKHVLVWHLYAVGPLGADFLHRATDVHRTSLLQPADANVQSAECACNLFHHFSTTQ